MSDQSPAYRIRPADSGPDEDVHRIPARAGYPVPPDRTGTGQEAVLTRVEQRGHLAVLRSQGPRVREVDTGQQYLPRATRPHSVVNGARRHAAVKSLRPEDDLPLLATNAVQFRHVTFG
jgi:hypothetical protein